ncbi:Mbeg1-like protein [Ruminococcus sp.]|uniref:Mbeg1-like protein n=1 Tax=Ruminococcus sp. TaxID=41978 RepID=UPI0025EB6815|nr:Mbeg1-like protein [Ruminococcus sp.]
MILSQLCYAHLGGVVPGGFDEEISIPDAYRRYRPDEVDVNKRILTFEQDNILFRKLAESKRFRGTTLRGFVCSVESDEDLQFSALTYRLGDNSGFLAFRGTDGTVVGWKEDFNLSFMQQTAGQERAIDYLNAAFENDDQPIRLGGHSKGGNFAIFSSLYCNESIRDRILNIYSYDGPGFRDEVIESEVYKNMLPKIKCFIPQVSIVGMLLGSSSEPKIVKNSAIGIKQHFAYNWELKRNRFILTDKLKKSGDVINKAISGMLDDFSDTEREIFTESLFEILQAPDKETLKELNKLRSYPSIIKAISKLKPEQQAVMKEAFRKIAQNGKGAFFK